MAFNYSTYPKARFVNEFGCVDTVSCPHVVSQLTDALAIRFLSQPSFYSWEEVLEHPADFEFNSTVVRARDHHDPAQGLAVPNPNERGQAQMTEAVERYLPRPGTPDANQTFAQWCWSTQLFQALNVAAEVAFYRRGAGAPEHNMGALVWQLNGVWQGTSWSALEHSGRWKALQYALSSGFAPVAVYPFWVAQSETLEVVVTSDRGETVRGRAQLTWYAWDGAVVNASTVAFAVPPLNSSVVHRAAGLARVLPDGKDAADVFLLVNVTADVGGRAVAQEQYVRADRVHPRSRS